jgi:pimeloyl-ACP methyl ester carboxylesterase
MFGILTEPSPSERNPDAPAVVFLNSGLLHRVGACRLHVRLARMVAPAGFASLRFDFSGVGDSEPRKDALAFEQFGVLEVQEAMDYLESAKIARSFVLVGLCSGADMAFETARVDERVEAIGQLDAYAYPTLRSYLHRYAPSLLRASAWRNVLTGKTLVGPFVRRLLRGRSATDAAESVSEDVVQSPYARDFPPRETVSAGLKTLVDRGVRLFNFFSSSYYHYRDQYRDCFGEVEFGDRLRLEFIPGADHVISMPADQRYVLGAISDWIGSLRPPLSSTAAPVEVSTSAQQRPEAPSLA